MRKTKAEIDVLLKSLSRAKVELIEPMLAKLSNSIPQGPNWLYELKFDGYPATRSPEMVAILDQGLGT